VVHFESVKKTGQEQPPVELQFEEVAPTPQLQAAQVEPER